MKVLYRACPYRTSKALPVDWDKRTIVKKCLYSFMETGANDITFLLDGFEDTSLFEPFGETIDCTGDGNEGTFARQIKLALNHDKVMFVEDDYIWRPNTFHLLERAVDELDFVSPYDHPGHYTEERFDSKYEMRLIGNTVYREAPSNTLTFATTGDVVRKLWPKMIAYGISDHAMFQHFRKLGYRMWNPTYSFATHLVKDLVAPNVDWKFENVSGEKAK